MNQCKLIMFDLDGTALLQDKINISPRLLAALERAHRTGIHIVPITGRPYIFLPPILRTDLPWKEICVLNNGGEFRRFSDGKIIDSAHMPYYDAKQIIELAAKYFTPIELTVNDKIMMTEADRDRLCSFHIPALQHHIDHDLMAHGHFADDLNQYAEENCPMVEKLTMPYVPPKFRRALFEEINRLPVSCVWGSPNGIEVTASEATKGNGLLWVCRYFDITPEACMAFGDSGNDVSMLKLAGMGVAMGNAPDPVKDAADLITDTNMEDGVAKVIEKYLLNQYISDGRNTNEHNV